jgi:non-structural maintenance of chromosomes element 4
MTLYNQSIGKLGKNHVSAGQEKIEKELDQWAEDDEEPTDEDVAAACRRQRVWQNSEGEAAVSLFDFAINPRSFGQTVENMFYISFLIREGNVKVVEDSDGLPLLGRLYPLVSIVFMY